MYLKVLYKQVYPRSDKWQEVIKIKAEISGIETKRTRHKIIQS